MLSNKVFENRGCGLLLVLCFLLPLIVFWGSQLSGIGETEAVNTLRSLSPNENYRVTLKEKKIFIDRNFILEMEDFEQNRKYSIFESPDEGLPTGSERILWSRNSEQFLLLGRKLHVHQDALLPNGEKLYLLYDLTTKTLKCNALQLTKYPQFTTNDLHVIEWFGYYPYPDSN